MQSKQTTMNSKTTRWGIWWRLLRPHTLTAAFVPVAIGTALGIESSPLHIPLFFAMLFASLFIQAATNMFNEYYDYKRGLDHAESVGIGGAIVREGVKARTVLYLAYSFFAIALLLGVYICILTSWWIAFVGLICMLFGYLYTGGPAPIAYTPLGEFFAGLFMGTVIIALSSYLQNGQVTPESIYISLPIAILIGAILMANNIRDLEGDQRSGRRTLAILLGKRNAIVFLGIMLASAYILIISLIALQLLSIASLLVFLSLPKAIQSVKGFIGKEKPIEMMPAMKATAQTNTIFGLLLAISLLL